jgi:DnaJ domain
MKLDSKYFDKIRIKTGPNKKEPPAPLVCEWPGCDKPARHKAPKGRGAEGQFHNYCTAHVQEYNKTYNYFEGMKDNDVAGFQKDAQTGHRPTWKLGQNAAAANNAYANINGMRRKARNVNDPFGAFAQMQENAKVRAARNLRRGELKALNTLGLDENATAEMAKTQYKTLVKRLHPDANGGSRENEDTLKAVIHAYDTLRASGFC